MVEGAALEMLFGGNFNEGSNPSLSVLKKAAKSFEGMYVSVSSSLLKILLMVVFR